MFKVSEQIRIILTLALLFSVHEAYSWTSPTNVAVSSAVIDDHSGTITDLKYDASSDVLWVVYSNPTELTKSGLHQVTGASTASRVVNPYNTTSNATLLTDVQNIKKIVLADANTIYGVTSTGKVVKAVLSRSAMTWNDQQDFSKETTDVSSFIKDGNNLYAATSYGVAKGVIASSDITWSWISGDGAGSASLLSATSLAVSGGFLYAGGPDGVMKMATTASSPSWTPIPSIRNIKNLAVVNNILYASTTDAAFYSLPISAATWTTIKLASGGLEPVIHSLVPLSHGLNMLGMTSSASSSSTDDGNIGLLNSTSGLSDNYYFDFIRTNDCSNAYPSSEYLDITQVISNGDAKAFGRFQMGGYAERISQVSLPLPMVGLAVQGVVQVLVAQEAVVEIRKHRFVLLLLQLRQLR
ncbi:MAG: hypothetical protein IPJ69_08730 [Deltaproteobacteria bacterium]|nr:MAG: hypothetical protein IPJ69_08730 [Deltaproteobacteria bacterium]